MKWIVYAAAAAAPRAQVYDRPLMGEEIHAVTIDRSKWGNGPWDDEPDRWEDRHAGFPVLAVRSSLGHWCGYVGVPPGHPWHGNSPEDEELTCHGGITYAGLCNGVICHVPREGEPAAIFWFGFDCMHAGDFSPGAMYAHPRDTYRDLTYVQKQTRAMADAAAAAAGEKVLCDVLMSGAD